MMAASETSLSRSESTNTVTEIVLFLKEFSEDYNTIIEDYVKHLNSSSNSSSVASSSGGASSSSDNNSNAATTTTTTKTYVIKPMFLPVLEFKTRHRHRLQRLLISLATVSSPDQCPTITLATPSPLSYHHRLIVTSARAAVALVTASQFLSPAQLSHVIASTAVFVIGSATQCAISKNNSQWAIFGSETGSSNDLIDYILQWFPQSAIQSQSTVPAIPSDNIMAHLPRFIYLSGNTRRDTITSRLRGVEEIVVYASVQRSPQSLQSEWTSTVESWSLPHPPPIHTVVVFSPLGGDAFLKWQMWKGGSMGRGRCSDWGIDDERRPTMIAIGPTTSHSLQSMFDEARRRENSDEWMEWTVDGVCSTPTPASLLHLLLTLRPS